MKKICLMLCSVIPLGLQMSYLFSAWSQSRLDQWDWLFYLAAIPAAVYAAGKEEVRTHDWWACCLLIPALVLALTGGIHHINALAVASSVVVIFAAVWLAASWRFAYRVLPAAVILLLGTPSSSYSISLLLMCPVWMAWGGKMLLTGLCFLWIGGNRRFDWQIKKGTLCFLLAVTGSCLLLLHSKEIYFEGKSFIPEFTGHIGDFWGRVIEPDENTKRFFVSGTVRQFRYTGHDVDISVLAVKCGTDIHEIHPASHCLRTSRWTIHSEKILYLQNDFAVTEIDAEKGANRFLIWVWYSGEDFSTPGFIGFRRRFRQDGNYHTYQISTPVKQDPDRSRKELQQFLQLLNGNRRIEK